MAQNMKYNIVEAIIDTLEKLKRIKTTCKGKRK